MIVVVGGGAIGQLVAGRLAQAGQAAALLGRASTVVALRHKPLMITEGKQTTQVVGLLVGDAPAELAAHGPVELAVLTVKAYDTPGALPTLDALNPQQILTLQNGIGNEELLRDRFGAARVLSGAITSSVVSDAPGRISVTKSGGIGLAALPGGPSAAPWAAALQAAGFVVQHYHDYRALKWSKALLNMLSNASSAILAMPPDAIYADARLFALERQAQLEALAVMDRLGIVPVDLPRYPAARLAWAMRYLPPALSRPVLRRLVAGGRGGKMPSLYYDLERGRTRSEGEQLYGAVADTARRLGLPAPANQRLWGTLKRIIGGEMAWDAFKGQPEQLLR
jgi:2-dehydropantoate 2-reductase